MKKGVFFSIDALIAVVLILSVIIISSFFYFNKEQATQPVYFSSDLVQILSTLKIGEINDPDVQALINASGITELDRTLLEQALIFQVRGNEQKATQLLNLTIGGLLPDYYHLGVWIEDYEDPIYTTSQQPITQLISSKQMVSGIKRDRAIEGLTTRAFLSSLNERTSSAYTYFGGYEGDGNITKKLILPNVITAINSVYMELDAGSAFDLYINDIPSGHYVPSGDMRADEWDINSSYLENLHIGENTIVLSFTGANEYVGGGYIRVDYSTSELENYYDDGTDTYYFPGIVGAINVYSSFYVPGSLNTMNIHLHYKSDYEVFLNIGDTTVFSYDLAGENIVNIPNDELSIKLNYSEISTKTVPLKIGIRNVSYYQMGFGGTADSMLVTDVSGSMDECGEYDSTTMCDYDCCVGEACPDSYSCESDTCVDEECGACQDYEQTCYYECRFWWFLCEYKSCESETCSDEECGSCSGWCSDTNHQLFGGQSTAQNNINKFFSSLFSNI